MEVDLYNQPVSLPRGGLRFSVELLLPPGFRVLASDFWPPGVRGGKLLYVPPCGGVQGAVSVLGLLEPWSERHPEFIVEGNEAGMLLGGEVRGADGAVWRQADVGERTGGFVTAAPVLAVEVAGQDEGEALLREKARTAASLSCGCSCPSCGRSWSCGRTASDATNPANVWRPSPSCRI